jgi:hypothetical protein
VTRTRTQCSAMKCSWIQFPDTDLLDTDLLDAWPGCPGRVARRRRKTGQGHPRHTDRCRGNAVGSPSVKVGAAPDTPSWGQVLARHLLRDRLDRRAGSVTLRQLSGSPSPLRIHETRGGRGEPGADGRSRRATTAVWARSETPVPGMESGLTLWSPPGTGSWNEGRGDARTSTVKARQKRQYLVRLISPGRDTGSNGRRRARPPGPPAGGAPPRPLPGKDPS